MNVTSPKERFQRTDAARAFAEQQTGIYPVLEVALLQLLWETQPTSEDIAAASQKHRIEGAQMFMRTLMTLTDKPQPAPKRPNDNLNYA